MAGLSLQSGIRVGGISGAATTPAAPQYGSNASYASGVNATSSAFGSGFTTPTPGGNGMISAANPHGLAFWMGVAAIGGLVFIRQSLPN